MIVLYGHLSLRLRSIKVVSAELALGSAAVMNSSAYPGAGVCGVSPTAGVTARRLCRGVGGEILITVHLVRQGRVWLGLVKSTVGVTGCNKMTSSTICLSWTLEGGDRFNDV